MRYDHLTIRDLGPFKHVDLDFAAISGKLVAVCGDNGSGKTTLLELLPGALYRNCPTRGSLTDLATSRNAFVEVAAANGKAWTIRQSADGTSGKSEALILNSAGAPVLESAKVRDADAWVARHLPPPEVMYASSFLAQQSTGFLELSAAERKRVLLRLLRIERYERMAERAREKSRGSKAECETLRARIEEARGEDVEALTTARAELVVQQSELALECTELEQRLATVRQELATVNATVTQSQKRLPLEAHLGELERDHKLARDRIANNRRLIADEVKIRARATQQRELTKERDENANERTTMQPAIAGKLEESRAATARRDRALERVHESEAEIESRKAQKAAAAKAETARAKLPAARAAHEAARTKLREIDEKLSEARKLLVDGRDARIGKLRTGLVVIGKGTANPKRTASSTLEDDDGLVRAQRAAPATIKRLEASRDAADTGCDEANEALAELRELANAKDGKDAERALATAQTALARAEAEAETEGNAAVVASLEMKKLRGQANKLDKRLAFLNTSLMQPDVAGALELEKKLEGAHARIEELEPSEKRMAAELERLRAEIASLPAAPGPRLVELDGVIRLVQTTLEQKRGRSGQLVQNIAALAQRITTAEAADVRARTFETSLELAERELADYTRLGQDLGKDGLQALEIDASIPELNTLANDLLHTCHGGRFTVELRTDRVAADGKRMLEDLEVRVIDTEHGRDAPVETYSGGEKVIVGEAISLALTMVACHRAGLTAPTLVRDESGAALDPGNGRSYIAMLRRAAELVGADKVLFVTHDPELQALADARIDVGDGTAVIA
jgi:exonuclease SbcC